MVNENGKLDVIIYGLGFSDLEKLGYYELANVNYSLAEAIPAGINKSYQTLTNYIKQLKKTSIVVISINYLEFVSSIHFTAELSVFSRLSLVFCRIGIWIVLFATFCPVSQIFETAK